MDNIRGLKNWLIGYNILFYCGLILCIIGWSVWWVIGSGLIVMILARIEEERIKDMINLK